MVFYGLTGRLLIKVFSFAVYVISLLFKNIYISNPFYFQQTMPFYGLGLVRPMRENQVQTGLINSGIYWLN